MHCSAGLCVCVERNVRYSVLIPLLFSFQVRHFSLYFSLTGIAVSIHVYHYIADVTAIRTSIEVLTFRQILHCLWRGHQKC
jgi:hypothetical protein